MNRGPQGMMLPITDVEEKASAYIPNPLPPNPPIRWTPTLEKCYDDALVALGRLDTVGELLPDPDRFVYSYIRKEAVLSSKIEGTQSSLSDLLRFETATSQGDSLDVQQVSRYVAALHHGLSRLADGFPLSLRLIREMHEKLLAAGRGAEAGTPGEFRRSQNWIGGTRPGNANFVPPPPHLVHEAMGKLELFLHDQPQATRPLLKAALAHVQFETIHPFLDGNGRLGRMLITLILCEQKILQKPLLYLSLYLKEHRSDYYRLLDSVRHQGNWEDWLDFFLRGVSHTANQAVVTAKAVDHLLESHKKQIGELGRITASARAVLSQMAERPVSDVAHLSKATGLSGVTVRKCLDALSRLGMVREVTDRKRGRIYEYHGYLAILAEGTE